MAIIRCNWHSGEILPRLYYLCRLFAAAHNSGTDFCFFLLAFAWAHCCNTELSLRRDSRAHCFETYLSRRRDSAPLPLKASGSPALSNACHPQIELPEGLAYRYLVYKVANDLAESLPSAKCVVWMHCNWHKACFRKEWRTRRKDWCSRATRHTMPLDRHYVIQFFLQQTKESREWSGFNEVHVVIWLFSSSSSFPFLLPPASSLVFLLVL